MVPLMVTLMVLLMLLLFTLSGCGINDLDTNTKMEPISETGFYLNTVITITIYDSEDTSLLSEAMKLCGRYENQLSRTIDTSEISQINSGVLFDEHGVAHLSKDTAELIEAGLYYSKLSDGAFDITIGPVSSLWDFTSEEPAVPDDAAIQKKLPLVGYDKLTLDGQKLQFSEKGMAIDPGAIAKGYIADRIKEYLISQHVGSAIINLGGNVLCIGSKPDGSAFKVGIQKPFADRNETIHTVDVADSSVVSSGIYERGFEQDGRYYHHILNPSTGYPYDNGLTSVTILSDTSVQGDGLSTTCFALGLEKGMELINQLDNTEAVFITADGELHYSDDFPR